MSVSRRSGAEIRTGRSTETLLATAAGVQHLAASSEHTLPVIGRDDAIGAPQTHAVLPENHLLAVPPVAKHGASSHPIVNSHEHLFATHAPLDSSFANTPDQMAAHDDAMHVSFAPVSTPLPEISAFSAFATSFNPQAISAIVAQHGLPATHAPVEPVQHLSDAPADSGLVDPELWIAATQGTSQNYITHADDDGTGNDAATNSGDLFTPISANNPSVADGIDGIDLFQLDTQDNVYFMGTQRGSNAAKIMEGSLSTVLGAPTGTPTFTTLFSDNTNTAAITGMAVDPDNATVYFVDSQSFEKVGYAGGTVTDLDTASVFLDGLALDLPHHVAYFASATAGTTTTTTGTHVHYHTGVTSNAIYETSNLTNSSSSVTISKLADIPNTDGAIFDGVAMPGITVDTTTGTIYFTTKTITGVGDGGIWSMTSAGAITKIYQQTGANNILNNGIINSIAVDHATGEYFVSILNHNGTGGDIFVGHLGSTAAPVLWEAISTFSSGTIDPSPEGFSLDNAPTFASVTGTGNYALQGGSAILTLSADGSDADSDNDKGDGAKIVITNPQSGDLLEIGGAQSGTTNGITWSYNSTTHTMTLSGTASFASYQALIDTIQFQDTGTDNSTSSHPTRTITYQTYDGLLYSAVTGADTITQLINRAPTLGADSYSAQESGSASGTSGIAGTGVLGNDSDKDGDTITVTAVNGSAGNVGASLAGTYGHLTLASNGSFSYTADNTSAIDAAATGSHPVDTFTYTDNDGLNGTTTTTVSFTINRAPTLAADSYSVVESNSASGTSGTGGTGVLGNDSDKDGDSLTVTAVNGSGANVGSGTFQGTYGHLNLAANGSFTYSADNTAAIDAAATGSHPVDTFTYTDSDGHGGTTTNTVSFTIDRAPTVTGDSGAAVEASSGTGNVLTNDSDKDGDTLTVSAVNGVGGNVGASVAGVYGHITINSNGSYTYLANNTAAIDGAATGSHLTDTFTYTDSDGHGGTTTTNLVVTLDRGPTVVTDTNSVVEELARRSPDAARKRRSGQ